MYPDEIMRDLKGYIVPNRDTIQVRHIKRSPKFTPTFELSSDATKIGTDVGASSSADQLASMTKGMDSR